MFEDEEYWEVPEPPAQAFCDRYVMHEEHTYWAINGNVYACSGFTAEDLADLMREAARPPCEHGMSASLCAGPNHYPTDNRPTLTPSHVSVNITPAKGRGL